MASIIKADNIQKVSDGSNIIKKCGSTITVGSSGQTVALASGASQTGFGTPTSSVLWCTTAKTSPFTAADQKGYFVNTSGGVVTVTLPSSPSAGDVVALKDYGNTWQTNAVTICRNSSKINGIAANTNLAIKSQSVTLIYVDSTKGWQDIQDSTSNITGTPNFIVACGGSVSTSGDFKIHTFTSTDTFKICSAPTPSNNNVSYLVIAGGGGASQNIGGGAGAGGFREGKTPATPYTSSPLVAPAGLPVSVTSYPITIGAGGSGGLYASATNGANTVFSSITSAGGGKSGCSTGGGPVGTGVAGGSGGGAGGGTTNPGGAGNTPPVSPPQGNAGGTASGGGQFPALGSGGGGGAAAAGGNGNSSDSGAGGAGSPTEISGSAVTRAGGGGGKTYSNPPGGSAGGAGGGQPGGPAGPARNGTANTGSGGASVDGIGGSGVVIIRYKFQ